MSTYLENWKAIYNSYEVIAKSYVDEGVTSVMWHINEIQDKGVVGYTGARLSAGALWLVTVAVYICSYIEVRARAYRAKWFPSPKPEGDRVLRIGEIIDTRTENGELGFSWFSQKGVLISSDSSDSTEHRTVCHQIIQEQHALNPDNRLYVIEFIRGNQVARLVVSPHAVGDVSFEIDLDQKCLNAVSLGGQVEEEGAEEEVEVAGLPEVINSYLVACGNTCVKVEHLVGEDGEFVLDTTDTLRYVNANVEIVDVGHGEFLVPKNPPKDIDGETTNE